MIKYGNFYHTYGKDVYILSYIFDYKIKEENGVYVSGFPINSINKIKSKLEEQKINYILIEKMNKEELMLLGVKFETRTEYARHIEICGEKRGSYSKTDESATFMRIKTDYMGNDQLLPAYNLQIGVCEEYIATIDVKQYASDMDCFEPLMEKFNEIYGKYPKYPIADAG